MDISYLNLAGTFYYLCSVLDGYSRYLVHREIRASMKGYFCPNPQKGKIQGPADELVRLRSRVGETEDGPLGGDLPTYYDSSMLYRAAGAALA